MPELLLESEPEFFPFEDMREVKQLVLKPEQYYFLVDRLKWGLERRLEDCGIITVNKYDDIVEIVEFYTLPDEFKTMPEVHIVEARKSGWYKELLEEVIDKQQKIGLNYHTHPRIEDYPSNAHEEYCTASRRRGMNPTLPYKKTRESDELEGKDMETTIRKLGDITIEMLKGDMVHMNGYTPATKPYEDIDPFGYTGLRWTHPLEIIVPELGLIYDSAITMDSLIESRCSFCMFYD